MCLFCDFTVPESIPFSTTVGVFDVPNPLESGITLSHREIAVTNLDQFGTSIERCPSLCKMAFEEPNVGMCEAFMFADNEYTLRFLRDFVGVFVGGVTGAM